MAYIKYNGKTLVNVRSGESVTLHTTGHSLTGDIEIEGYGGSGGGTDMIPTFDLRTRGFPTVLTDGTVVTHATDTTDIMSALAKGAVKFIFTASMGNIAIVVESVITNTYIQGDNAYLCGTLIDVEGTMAYFSLTVTTGVMLARVLVVPTTQEVETLVEYYVSSYIGDALGGDY